MKKILFIGGGGYVGTNLTQKLINKEIYEITIYDLFLYGDFLPNNKKIKKIIGDVRDIEKLSKYINETDIIIHFACISNDPSFDLIPKLSKEINYDSFKKLIEVIKLYEIERFIFASSSSVYGIKENIEVDETCTLDPLTDYSLYKAECEKILLDNSNKFISTIVRPATVCGYSPRQRLDVVMNIFSNYAYFKREIRVFGGKQLRPNININDLSEAYMRILEADKKLIDKEIFNIGDNNYSLSELANLVKKESIHKVSIIHEKSFDDRSYHISSNKFLQKFNFSFENGLKNAVRDLFYAFENKLLLDTFNNADYFNIQKIKKINLV